MTRNLTLTEHEESVIFANYLATQVLIGKVLVYSKIPSETYTKGWAQKVKNVREGVKRGVPDYIVVMPSYVVFVELKRTKGGVIGEEQKVWHEVLSNREGVKSYICYGADEAIAVIEKLKIQN